MKYLIVPLFFIFISSCTPPAPAETIEETSITEAMQPVWEAHGGIDVWKSFERMKFSIGDGEDLETHYIHLLNRKVLIEGDSFALGMDGERIWVAPNLDAFERDPRFYHNLIFYFVAIPYVFADPGVNIESIGTRRLDDTEYEAIAVSFDEGTGDADDDEYIMLINPETNLVEWLLYTVTYFSGEKGERYNALHYGDYRNVNGLQMVGKLSGYTYANDTTGTKRYEREIKDYTLDKGVYENQIFEKPESAEFFAE